MLSRRNALILLPMAAVGAGAGYVWTRSQGAPALPAGFDMSANAQESTIEIPEMTMGDPDAPVKIVEYASFTCPHCANFHRDTFKPLKEQFIETGQVHFTYREVYFDRYGLWAGIVARCAGADKYFGMVDLIYQTQAEWIQAGEPAAIAASLKKLGLQAGMDGDKIDACLNDGEMAQALYAWFQRNATADGIDSTPTLLINGTKQSGNMSIDRLATLINAEL